MWGHFQACSISSLGGADVGEVCVFPSGSQDPNSQMTYIEWFHWQVTSSSPLFLLLSSKASDVIGTSPGLGMNGRPAANQDARCDASEEGELVSRLSSAGDCSRRGCDQLSHRHRESEKTYQRLSFAAKWLLYVGKLRHQGVRVRQCWFVAVSFCLQPEYSKSFERPLAAYPSLTPTFHLHSDAPTS
jgi:hypothetical protein